VVYTTWEKLDVDNLCPGDLCGPFCNTSDPSCFVKYRIPKDPSDPTPGGRNLSSPSGTTDTVGSVYELYCPPNCCNTTNCERYRDIDGTPVPVGHNILLVFGGIGLRNVTVNGNSLYNSCGQDNINSASSVYDSSVTQSCGIQLLNEIWEYDINDNTWNYFEPTYQPTTSAYSFPYPRHSHASVLVHMAVYDPTLNLLRFQFQLQTA
jgi:hypothetical protein